MQDPKINYKQLPEDDHGFYLVRTSHQNKILFSVMGGLGQTSGEWGMGPKELAYFLISSERKNPLAVLNWWEFMVSRNQGKIHQKVYYSSVDQKLQEAK